MIRLHIFAFVFLVASGCAIQSGSGGGSSVTPEPSYCSTVTSYSPAHTITGTAVYRKRLPESGGLSASESSDYAIRYAEIQVLNSSGTAIQCGETSSTGTFSLQVPQTGQTYTLKVSSRAFNSTAKASVLDTPSTNVPYSISTTFVANADKSVGTIVASGVGDTVGAAFNILDQIVKANLYLIQYTANCSTFYASCSQFSPTVKASVYWKAGVNPGTYVGSSSSLSFYLQGRNELYILGGKNGDMNSSDTDHYDDSIITHEYGHFIEDNWGKTDSPGGFHSASYPIDARLAWGEGWANFFSNAVLESSVYRDSCGYKVNSTTNSPCGSSGYFFSEDMDSRQLDIPSSGGSRLGEGNFRELAITRTLWTFQKNPNQARFNQLWANFTGPFKATSEAFRNVGLFLEKHSNALTGPTAFSALATEQQVANRNHYATPVSVTGSCTYSTTYGTAPTTFPSGVAFGSTRRPYDWLANNDVYDLNITSSGSYTFTVARTGGAAGVASAPDVDLYLYSQSHRYIYEVSATSETCSFFLCFDKSTTALKVKNDASDTFHPVGSSVTITTTLTPGRYLLMVNFFASTNDSVTYRLQQNGSDLCQ